MISVIVSLVLAVASQVSTYERTDSIGSTQHETDTCGVDTLREVTVRAGRHIPLPGMVINPKLKEAVVPPPSLGDILNKLSPGLKDKIMYPFAFKERRREKRRRRSLKALEDFDKVRTFDELLREAYERQLLEDSLNNHTK